MTGYEEAFRNQHSETMDCVVLSLASACGVSYLTAHAACYAHGRVKAGNTDRDVARAALEHMGWEVRREWTRSQFALELGVPEPALADLEDISWLPRMLVFVNDGDHVAPFYSGRVHDWSANTEASIDEAWEIGRVGIATKAKLPPVIFL